MLVGSPVHFVLNLFEEQNRAFSMGIIINAGCIDFQNLSPEYFFGRTDVSLPTQSKNQALGVDVYPNPMANTAVVNYYIPSKYTNPQMVIRNMVGKTLKTYSLKSGVQTKLNISSSSLSNGVYFYSKTLLQLHLTVS